jgi:hypothetical protein
MVLTCILLLLVSGFPCGATGLCSLLVSGLKVQVRGDGAGGGI